MFLKSVITDEISQDLEEAAKLAAQYGLDAVELRTVDERSPFEWSDEDIAHFQQILNPKNLSVCCIASPFYKCSMDDKIQRAEHISGLKRCVRAANQFGIKLIRGFCFWESGNLDERLDEIVSYFHEPIKILEASGMTLALESEPSVYSRNAAALKKIIQAINSENIKAVWDPGNDIQDIDEEIPFPDGYRIIKPYMVHMHLKDADIIDGKRTGVPVGKGKANLEGQLAALLEDGYRGYVSLETHYRKNIVLEEDLIAKPGGSTFSDSGYEATEECLIYWRDIMNRISPGCWGKK